jgi:thiamine-phosphate pyrophosphorylase
MAGATRAAAPRLYLAVPASIEPARMDDIAAALKDADVAAVLLRLPSADPRTLTERIKAFAPGVQATGAALLVDGHADLVARGGADGAHLAGLAALKDVQSSLQPQRIAGVGGLATRHDAMEAGEAGADYVLFGEPPPKGPRPSREAVMERVAWWAELFELPCVAYATDRAEAEAFASAGADFVLVEDWVWSVPDAAGAALMDAAQAIGQGRR